MSDQPLRTTPPEWFGATGQADSALVVDVTADDFPDGMDALVDPETGETIGVVMPLPSS